MQNPPAPRKGIALLKWIRLIFTAGIEIVFSYFAWMLRYSAHPEKYPLEERYAKVHGLALSLSKKLRMNLDENFSSSVASLRKSTLIVSNHLSIMDIVALLALSQRPITFIGKKEVERTPFVGRCVKAIGGYFLDRQDPKQAVRLFMRIGKAMKQSPTLVVVYPEGTRLKDPFQEVGEFHAGTFKLLEWGDADLLPLSCFGTFRPLSKAEHERSFPVEIKALPLKRKEEFDGMSTVEIASFARKEIASQVEEFKRYDIAYYEQKKNRVKAGKWWRK